MTRQRSSALTNLLQLQSIKYSELTAQLGISSIRELEDLIITECFYKGIVSGKLDQQRRCLQVLIRFLCGHCVCTMY